MNLHVTSGPPASGKTTAAVAQAHQHAADGLRVWWVAPGHQRRHVQRALARQGPILGVDVMTLQQVTYRLMSDLRELKPLLTGTGRLALIGRSLAEESGNPPSPGEARLFAHAIAEAKRYGVPPGSLPQGDDELARLARTYARYEDLKTNDWDYDDFLLQARDRLERHEPGELPIEADCIIVDGFGHLEPIEADIVQSLARHRPVELYVETAPPHVEVHTTLADPAAAQVHTHRFSSDVQEARWVLRDIKQELATGREPLDMAVVVPVGRSRAFMQLAREFGLPVMDETPKSLADQPLGRRLLDVLELDERPSPSRLLAVPDLRPLGNAALDAGVAGLDAIERLAEQTGTMTAWHRWRNLLSLEDDPLTWGATLLDAVIGSMASAGDDEQEDTTHDSGSERFKERALARLAEARQVAEHESSLKRWWAALLEDDSEPARPAAGIALLHPNQIQGRHFARVWLVGATQGRYDVREAEDYFVPEDDRQPLTDAYRQPGLPKRFTDHNERLKRALLRRAEAVTVTFATSENRGRALPDPILAPGRPSPTPDRPAGSAMELGQPEPFGLSPETVDLGPANLGDVARFERCPTRWWADARLPSSGPEEAWLDVRQRLREKTRWDAADLHTLASELGEHAEWLREHAGLLATFRFGVTLRTPDRQAYARVDAERHEDGVLTIVRFTAPGRPLSTEPRAWEERREVHYAQLHATQAKPAASTVQFWQWPIGSDPEAFPARPVPIDRWPVVANATRMREARVALWRQGVIEPKPGHHCRSCPHLDLCRVGQRA